MGGKSYLPAPRPSCTGGVPVRPPRSRGSLGAAPSACAKTSAAARVDGRESSSCRRGPGESWSRSVAIRGGVAPTEQHCAQAHCVGWFDCGGTMHK